MNPLTNVKNLQKINQRELELGIVGKKSWHDEYKDSAWIFIGGLPYELTEGDVICVFSQYGELVNINMVRDKQTGKTKGFAFLCYEDQRSTVLAVDNLNSFKLCGRTLRVDHVLKYKLPKELQDADELTKKIRSEGIAPKTPSPEPEVEEEEEEEDYVVPVKKIKKEKGSEKKKKDKKIKKEKKNKKKKEKEESSCDSSSESGSESIPQKQVSKTVKVEKRDVGYEQVHRKQPREVDYQDIDRKRKEKNVRESRRSHERNVSKKGMCSPPENSDQNKKVLKYGHDSRDQRENDNRLSNSYHKSHEYDRRQSRSISDIDSNQREIERSQRADSRDRSYNRGCSDHDRNGNTDYNWDQDSYKNHEKYRHYERSQYQESGRNSDYRDYERNSDYRDSERNSDLRDSERHSEYRNSERHSEYRDSERHSKYHDSERHSEYREYDRRDQYDFDRRERRR